MGNNRFLIIDGNSMLFRAFYATSYGNIMKTSKGEYTNAIYAFSNMLNKAIMMIKPMYVAVAFDKGKHTFRHELYQDYKAGRKQTPVELIGQFQLARDMMEAYDIAFFELDDIEADDIIGTLSNKFRDNIDTYILSSDKDMLQLVDEDTTVVMMKKGISEILEVTPLNIVENYGVRADQIVDLKGLMGDSSDNIKGIDGVGEKTALKLINSYEHIENIYEHLDELKGKMKEKIIAGRDNAYLSKKIATIKTDVELDINIDDFKLDIDHDKLESFFKRYEMFSLIKNIPVKNIKNENKINKNYNVVNRISDDLLKDDSIFYCYFSDFNYYDNDLLAIGITNGQKLEIMLSADILNDHHFIEYLGSEHHKKTIDLKVIKHYFNQHHITINNTDDLYLMGFLINNNISDLNRLFNHFGLDTFIDKTMLLGTIARPKIIDNDLLIKQISKILESLFNIYPKMLKQLKKDELDKLYYDLELPLIDVLFKMEKQGILVDEKILDEISSQTLNRLKTLHDKIIDLAGIDFNINSPKQLANVLFDHLLLKTNKKRSTSIEVLEFLEDHHPIIPLIIEYRKYSKIYSTYSEGLKKYIDKNHRIHTIFTQTITQTGRLSSYDPNLQNISVRSDEGREIRKAFIADEGCMLVSSDYSQIELRILAHMACEDNLIKAFNDNLDIHTKTAMDIFNISYDEVNSDYRRKAKAINFGIIYGISDFGLAKQADISIGDAKTFMQRYFEKYPKIKSYMDGNVEYLMDNGYVKTILNRRRYINEIHDRNYTIREFGKRAAFNSPIQGSGADIIKTAMLNIARMIDEQQLKSSLILQIHDELIFNVYHDEQEKMQELIKKGMREAYKLMVPLASDYHVSASLHIDK